MCPVFRQWVGLTIMCDSYLLLVRSDLCLMLNVTASIGFYCIPTSRLSEVSQLTFSSLVFLAGTALAFSQLPPSWTNWHQQQTNAIACSWVYVEVNAEQQHQMYFIWRIFVHQHRNNYRWNLLLTSLCRMWRSTNPGISPQSPSPQHFLSMRVCSVVKWSQWQYRSRRGLKPSYLSSSSQSLLLRLIFIIFADSLFSFQSTITSCTRNHRRRRYLYHQQKRRRLLLRHHLAAWQFDLTMII